MVVSVFHPQKVFVTFSGSENGQPSSVAPLRVFLFSAVGHFSGMKFPHTAEQLKSFGPSWYTDAFHKLPGANSRDFAGYDSPGRGPCSEPFSRGEGSGPY